MKIQEKTFQAAGPASPKVGETLASVELSDMNSGEQGQEEAREMGGNKMMQLLTGVFKSLTQWSTDMESFSVYL